MHCSFDRQTDGLTPRTLRVPPPPPFQPAAGPDGALTSIYLPLGRRAGRYLHGRLVFYAAFWLALATTVALWWVDTPGRSITDTAGVLVAAGQLTGLIGGFTLLFEIFLMSRVGWLSVPWERTGCWSGTGARGGCTGLRRPVRHVGRGPARRRRARSPAAGLPRHVGRPAGGGAGEQRGRLRRAGADNNYGRGRLDALAAYQWLGKTGLHLERLRPRPARQPVAPSRTPSRSRR